MSVFSSKSLLLGCVAHSFIILQRQLSKNKSKNSWNQAMIRIVYRLNFTIEEYLAELQVHEIKIGKAWKVQTYMLLCGLLLTYHRYNFHT